ncbi:MAG: SH3 domain-containing protein [Pseudomonadota bacterium]
MKQAIKRPLMRLPQAHLLAALTCLWTAANVHAADFKSIGAAPAILYDAPSEKGRKVFVAPRGMPVEVVLSYNEWVKVRDSGGDLSWVEAKQLSNRRMLTVTASNAKVRATADDNAAVVMTAERGVLLELSDAVASGWVRVKHRDGIVGFIKATDVWGE